MTLSLQAPQGTKCVSLTPGAYISPKSLALCSRSMILYSIKESLGDSKRIKIRTMLVLTLGYIKAHIPKISKMYFRRGQQNQFSSSRVKNLSTFSFISGCPTGINFLKFCLFCKFCYETLHCTEWLLIPKTTVKWRGGSEMYWFSVPSWVFSCFNGFGISVHSRWRVGWVIRRQEYPIPTSKDCREDKNEILLGPQWASVIAAHVVFLNMQSGKQRQG